MTNEVHTITEDWLTDRERKLAQKDATCRSLILQIRERCNEALVDPAPDWSSIAAAIEQTAKLIRPEATCLSK